MAMKLKKATEETIEKFYIYVDDQKIGFVKESTSGNPWHACIEPPNASIMMNLAQGHGDSAHEAIDAAFSTSIADAEEFISELSKLQARMIKVEENEQPE